MSIEKMYEIAATRGGKCLSEQYFNARTKMLWECAKGHRWETTADKIKNKKTWCPYCAECVKSDIDEMRELAKARGGKCLSDQYVNTDAKLLWECDKGHRWEATGYHVKRRKSWCPICAGRQKLTIDEMKAIAHAKGGRCLSEQYVNNQTKLQWECSKGHTWESTPSLVKNGAWCPVCAGNAKCSLEEFVKIAESRGGTCVSRGYQNNNTKLTFRCAKNHEWDTIPYSIKKGHWCPYCAGSARRSLDEMQKIASSRGGKCLSNHYKNNQSKLTWECAFGHQWDSAPASIINGTWCPHCSSGLGERICREHFEQIFGHIFPKSYPKWLANDDGNQMELDGYCENLGIAFEYQGEQHYSLDTHYITSAQDLERRQRHDEMKFTLCQLHGVLLFQIPEIWKRMDLIDLKPLILKQSIKTGIPLLPGSENITINLLKAYSSNSSFETLADLQRLAAERGGKCHSTVYKTAKIRLPWECSEGHLWKATPDSIIRGSWCPVCGKQKSANSRRLDIAEIHKIAKERGGKCLSENYSSAKEKLVWECASGHRWEARLTDIINRSWCPYCGGSMKLTLDEMRTIAANRGGRCHSEQYVNNQTKLLWECNKGHQWYSAPNKIKMGTWCPVCGVESRASKKRLTIEAMKELAEVKGGRCLSDVYRNANSKLLWRCSSGHEWEAIPASVIKGHWCRKCHFDRVKRNQKGA